MAEAKSPPRKRHKSNNLSRNCLLSACFGSFSCSDDEVDVGRWSTTTRTVKRVVSDDHVESEKAEAQRRYDDKKLRKMKKKINYNKLQSSSIDQQTSMEEAQNPSSEKHVDRLPSFSRNIDAISASAGAGAFSSVHRNTLALAPPSRTVIHKKPSTRHTGTAAAATAVTKKLDPVVGLSVVLVTMVIMIVWGRLCAILCTSAWFYFTSKFKSTTVNSVADTKLSSSPLRLDLESEEHKKKVVLEGFLERKRR